MLFWSLSHALAHSSHVRKSPNSLSQQLTASDGAFSWPTTTKLTLTLSHFVYTPRRLLVRNLHKRHYVCLYPTGNATSAFEQNTERICFLVFAGKPGDAPPSNLQRSAVLKGRGLTTTASVWRCSSIPIFVAKLLPTLSLSYPIKISNVDRMFCVQETHGHACQRAHTRNTIRCIQEYSSWPNTVVGDIVRCTKGFRSSLESLDRW